MREERGKGLPKYVEDELHRYLRCGVLAHGFLRVACPSYHQEILVALRDVMRESAEWVVREVVASGRSVLLTRPGLRARCRLDRGLTSLVEATQKDDGPAVFLLVPCYDEPGPRPIDAVPDPMPIPQASPVQRLRVPESSIENRHRAGV